MSEKDNLIKFLNNPDVNAALKQCGTTAFLVLDAFQKAEGNYKNLRHLQNDNINSILDSIYRIIESFAWGHTEQGFEYWSNVYNNIDEEYARTVTTKEVSPSKRYSEKEETGNLGTAKLTSSNKYAVLLLS